MTEVDHEYDIGHRDGYEKATQDIDILTGGNGDFTTILGADIENRNCPDAQAMKARIKARFDTQAATIRALQEENEGLREERDHFRKQWINAIIYSKDCEGYSYERANVYAESVVNNAHDEFIQNRAALKEQSHATPDT
jgi:hypothetical protein